MARFGQGLIASLANPSWADAAGIAGAQLGMLGGKMREERMQSERLNTLRGMDEGQRLQYAVTNAKTPEALSEAMANLETFQRAEAVDEASTTLASIQADMRAIATSQGGKPMDKWDQEKLNSYVSLQARADQLAANTRGIDQQQVSGMSARIADATTAAAAQAQALQNNREAALERQKVQEDRNTEREIAGNVLNAMGEGEGSVDTYIQGLDPEWREHAREVYNRNAEFDDRRRARREAEADAAVPLDLELDIPANLDDNTKLLVKGQLAAAQRIVDRVDARGGTWLPMERRQAQAARDAAENLLFRHVSNLATDEALQERAFRRSLESYRPREDDIEAVLDEVNGSGMYDFFGDIVQNREDITREQAINILRQQHARRSAEAYGQPVPDWAVETARAGVDKTPDERAVRVMQEYPNNVYRKMINGVQHTYVGKRQSDGQPDTSEKPYDDPSNWAPAY